MLSRYKPNNKCHVISHFGLNVNEVRITEVSDWGLSLFYHARLMRVSTPKSFSICWLKCILSCYANDSIECLKVTPFVFVFRSSVNSFREDSDTEVGPRWWVLACIALNDDVRRPTNFDPSNWYLEISLLDRLDHHHNCGSSPISLLTTNIACSSLQNSEESQESGSREVPRKPSKSWSSEACKHCFQYLIPVYQLRIYPMIYQLRQFTSTLT